MENRISVNFIAKDKNAFFSTVRKRVNVYFENEGLSRYANPVMILKSFSLLSAYLLPLGFIFVINPPFWLALAGWALTGLALAGIGIYPSYTPIQKKIIPAI